MRPMPPNIYHQPQQNISYHQNIPTTSNDVSMVINKTVQLLQYIRCKCKIIFKNEQYMSSNRVMIPSPSSAFTSAANTNDESTINRKVKVAANFNSSQ